MTISVCHLLSRFEIGGLENGVANLCNGHDRERFAPWVCCVKGGGRMAERLRPDVRLDVLGASEGKNVLRPLRLAAYFHRTRPDIVHTHGWGQSSFDGIIGARLAGVPVVINGEHGTFQTKGYQVLLQRFLATLCDTTLSVSHAHKEKVVEVLGIPAETIQVVHNGVDTGLFTGAQDTAGLRAELKQHFGLVLPDNAFVVACIGSVKPIKNQQLLVRAAALLRQRMPGVPFAVLFVGTGPDLAAMRDLVKELGVEQEVYFLDERPDVPIVLSLADVLVLPSQTGKEGLPNVVLEAMASGCPVISTQSVGTHEVMVEGETGHFLAGEDPAELCNYLAALASDPAKVAAMGARARTHTEKRFSIAAMVAGYESLYASLKT